MQDHTCAQISMQEIEYMPLPKHAMNIAGQRYGRLVALGPVERRNKRIIWLCRCDCGKTANVALGNLRNAHTKSCGCLKVDVSADLTKTHGMSNHRLYGVWGDMIQRCTNPARKAYINYGGRGISVHKEWLVSFESFHEYVSRLSNYDKKGCSLDRIDNDGNYEPGNVRWATTPEQGRNTRANHMISFNGKTQCLVDWARETGLKPSTICRRFNAGWSIERVLTTPVKQNKLHVQLATPES